VTTRPGTLLHGLCLVDGKHTPGSAAAKECPLLHASKRSERSRKAAQARWKRRDEGAEKSTQVTPSADAPQASDGAS